MANTATVQEVVVTHPDLKGVESRVPVTAVRVLAKTGWQVKEGDDKKLVEAIEKGEASPAVATVEGEPAKASGKK